MVLFFIISGFIAFVTNSYLITLLVSITLLGCYLYKKIGINYVFWLIIFYHMIFLYRLGTVQFSLIEYAMHAFILYQLYTMFKKAERI